MSFDRKVLPREVDAISPDGSELRVLLELRGGSVAHFALAPGQCSVAARIEVAAGVCITLPLGTEFQFRSFGPIISPRSR